MEWLTCFDTEITELTVVPQRVRNHTRARCAVQRQSRVPSLAHCSLRRAIMPAGGANRHGVGGGNGAGLEVEWRRIGGGVKVEWRWSEGSCSGAFP